MIKNHWQTILCITMCFCAFGKLSAQGRISGRVYDTSTGRAVQGAAIQSGSSKKGTVSDMNGTFTIQVSNADSILIISHISYKESLIRITEIQGEASLSVGLIPDVTGLEEVNIIATYVHERETPVAVSSISAAVIEQETGNQEFPEIMKMVPGVYATRLGGGSGDARISIRGFQQENIAVLLNGIPVSSVENGLIYWSNWSGLSDATQSIQVQRGLGASRVALNSVGGTINIITKSTEARKGGSIRYALSDYGNTKTTISLSGGKSEHGFAVTFLGSRTTGPGYVDATYVDAWSYFLTISKELSRSHSIVFTCLGSPERHGQRNYGLTLSEHQRYGNKYNPNWGMLNGRINSLSENFYHKPQLALNHYWKLNDKALLASSAYLSFGTGGGKYAESFMSDPAAFFRKNNQIDWDSVILLNTLNNDTVRLAAGEQVSGFSKIIQTNYLADHIWYGVLSTLKLSVGDNIKIISGLHARYFKSHLREEISDLLGGNFWVDTYAWTIDGISGRPQIKGVGDIINVDNDSRVDVVSFFLQTEIRLSRKFTAFVASTLNETWYRRYDRMNYVFQPESRLISKTGADAKGGINFNADDHQNFYLNLGYYTKAPYFTFVFANFSNAPVQNLRNEKIASAEIGYNFLKTNTNLRINSYYTYWKDKSLLSDENIQLENGTDSRALIRGLDARHMGIEIEYEARLLQNFSAGASASAGSWRWCNDVRAFLYNDQHELLDSTAVYVNNILVGDAPQTTTGLFADLRILKAWNLKINWMHYSRLYANFDPSGRNNPADRSQPYRMPDYSVTDVHIVYAFQLADMNATAGISCYNLMNKISILRGEDGNTHSLESFRGFWSPGRTFNFSFMIRF